LQAMRLIFGWHATPSVAPDGSFELLVCPDKHAYNVLSWQQHLAERPPSIATTIKNITGT